MNTNKVFNQEDFYLTYADDMVSFFDPTQPGFSLDSIIETFLKQFSKFFDKKLEPNYFLCIKTNNQKIKDSCTEAQKGILVKKPDLVKACVKVESLHITLLAFYLENNEEIQLFCKKLEENRHFFEDLKNFHLTFQGVSTFGDKVVYVDLLKDTNFDKLIKFQSNLVKVAEKMQIPLFEKKFSPHMTLIKLSKARNLLLKKGIKKIDKELYGHLLETHFGIESIQKIHLCSIREKDPNNLFYKTFWEFELNKF